MSALIYDRSKSEREGLQRIVVRPAEMYDEQ